MDPLSGGEMRNRIRFIADELTEGNFHPAKKYIII
jgi:hypothetical protein